jgi:hypothetical protein
VKTDKTAEI